MNKLKIGAIGCGYWGPNLIRNFIEIPGANLQAVADLDQNRLDHISLRYPQIKLVTQNYTDFFKLDLDAVIISTPPPTHFVIARDCLVNGLNVLLEKPITVKAQDAQELIAIAEQRQLVLMVGHTFEYNPAVHLLREMIASGELGEVHYIDAVRASLGLFHPTLNVIWDLAPHDISILIHILGMDPLKVSTQGAACIHHPVEDIAYMTLKFPNEILAHIRMSWLDPCKTRRITVVGSKKMVVYDDVESMEKIKIYNKSVKAIRRTDTFGEFQFSYNYGDVISPYIHLEEPLRLECLHFLECIRENKSPLTDGYNGLKVVNIIEAAQQSLANGGDQVSIESRQRVLTNGKVIAPVAVNGTLSHPNSFS